MACCGSGAGRRPTIAKIGGGHGAACGGFPGGGLGGEFGRAESGIYLCRDDESVFRNTHKVIDVRELSSSGLGTSLIGRGCIRVRLVVVLVEVLLTLHFCHGGCLMAFSAVR